MANNTKKGDQKGKGFTLIELLVVIAILSVLAVAVTIVINPAELLEQGRDSTRLSDLSAIQSAVSLYLADQNSPSFNDTTNCTTGTDSATSSTSGTCNHTTSTAVDGTGWVDIDFTKISSGAPISNLPLDPVNNDLFFYVFDSTTNEKYELNANMESNAFSTGGSD
ncbi:MAG: type II secretion system protein, partial [Candidatus Magasanikbacteria bacterium]